MRVRQPSTSIRQPELYARAAVEGQLTRSGGAIDNAGRLRGVSLKDGT